MKYIIMIAIFIISISCTKEVNNYTTIDSDKEIRIDFPYYVGYGGYNMGDTSYSNPKSTAPHEQWLIEFDVSNYYNINEVYYLCKFRPTQYSDSCLIDLYNETDKKSVENSQLVFHSKPGDGEIIYIIKSNNILKSLPNKPVDLAFRIKCYNKNDLFSFVIADASLILKRKQ